MAISIDAVYQKVLTFANKEQRGYITPQQFNLFADQAQKEIFEQYFYDLNQASRASGNFNEYSDTVDNLNEKIAVFERDDTGTSLAENLYRLGTVTAGFGENGLFSEVEEVQHKEYFYMQQSFLTAPTEKRRVYIRTNASTIVVYPTATNVSYTYVATPTKPSWGYVVVNGKAMHDASNTVNFQLHKSDESELVYRILAFAGISMQKPNLAQSAAALEQAKVQQEKQ
jgi:hypothetical protein